MEATNYIEKLKSLEVRPDDPVERDQVLAFIKADYGWTDIMTLGNISTVIGKAKSRKTFFITLLVSSLVTNRNNYFRSNLNSNIVIFDTEQGRYHVWKMTKRIEAIVGNFPLKLKVFALRPLNTSERLQVIENYLYTNDGIELVIIDGIRDLVTDINSAEQATDIVGRLMKWSYEQNLHICSVLHQNKADDNARGHIGTEIVNKSETVIQVAKHNKAKEYSIVSSVYTRGKEIKEFQFKVENNLPVTEDIVFAENEKDEMPF